VPPAPWVPDARVAPAAAERSPAAGAARTPADRGRAVPGPAVLRNRTSSSQAARRHPLHRAASAASAVRTYRRPVRSSAPPRRSTGTA